jgi:hypothetical protein
MTTRPKGLARLLWFEPRGTAEACRRDLTNGAAGLTKRGRTAGGGTPESVKEPESDRDDN